MSSTKQVTTNVAVYALLATMAGVSLILPSHLDPQGSMAAPPKMAGDTILTVNTVVRDFKKGVPADFGSGISGGGTGHYAGNVMTDLGPNGAPTFVGLESTPLTDFKITNGAVIPQKPFAAMVTIIGAAYKSESKTDPVTTRAIINGTSIDPFGNFNTPLASNVNGISMAKSQVMPSMYAAGTPIHISGSSWAKKSSGSAGTKETDWQVFHTYSTTTASANIKVLRDGDSVPNNSGASGQMSVAQYLAPYVNATTKKVTIKKNQVIYLFELGSNSDYQDLVMLVTLGESTGYLATLDATGGGGTSSATPKGYKVQTEWRDSAGRAIPPAMFGTAPGDVAGAKGSASSGGISSGTTFGQWYTDVMGTNLSAQVALPLKKTNGDVWEYLSDDFHPVDNTLLGNEGQAHNSYFTMNFGMDFTHHAGEHRFIEFQGDDDMWVFVDGKLVMDIGGIKPGVKQYLDVDRIPGLSDGGKHHVEFFYAQRQECSSMFRLRTNLDLGAGTTQTYAVTAAGD